MHPAFLDACLHAYPLVLDGAEKAKSDRRKSYLPVSLEGFRCYQDGTDNAWVHTRLRSVEKDDTQVIDIRVYDEAERPIADLDGLTVRLLPLDKVQSARRSHRTTCSIGRSGERALEIPPALKRRTRPRAG